MRPVDPRPRLIVVSGPPGSGKTTLAHALGKAIPCPVICRDEIKEGLVDAPGGPDRDRELSEQTNRAFFGVVRLLVESRVTLVAEAAFQHQRWAPGLEPLLDLADVRVLRCTVPVAVARDRIAHRLADGGPLRVAHADADLLARIDRGEVSLERWEPIGLDVPQLTVDTTSERRPGLAHILAFIRG